MKPTQPILISVFQPWPATSDAKLGIEDERWKWVAGMQKFVFPCLCLLVESMNQEAKGLHTGSAATHRQILTVGPWPEYWAGWLWWFPSRFQAHPPRHFSTLLCRQVRLPRVRMSCLLRRSTQEILALKTEARRFSPATTFSVFDKWVMC